MSFITQQPILSGRKVLTAAGDWTITNEALVVVKKDSGAATAVNLPKMTEVGFTVTLLVMDGKGDAATNNITVTPNGSETINGAATLVISANYGVATLTWTGTEWIGSLLGGTSASFTGNVSIGGTLGVTGLASFTTAGIDVPAVARTATADGTGTGTIAAAGDFQLVTVTSADANNIIVLPPPTPGVMVHLRNGATGYELRTSAPASISINGGSGASAESAIAANTWVMALCTSATTWQAIGLAGTTLAAVEAAA